MKRVIALSNMAMAMMFVFVGCAQAQVTANDLSMPSTYTVGTAKIHAPLTAELTGVIDSGPFRGATISAHFVTGMQTAIPQGPGMDQIGSVMAEMGLGTGQSLPAIKIDSIRMPDQSQVHRPQKAWAYISGAALGMQSSPTSVPPIQSLEIKISGLPRAD